MTDEDKTETVKPLSRREKLLALFAEWDANPLSDRESAKVSAVIEHHRSDPILMLDIEDVVDAWRAQHPAPLRVTRSVEYGMQGGPDSYYQVLRASSEEEAVRDYCTLTGITKGVVTCVQLPHSTKYEIEPAPPAVVPDAVRRGGWPQPRWGISPVPLKSSPGVRLRAFNRLRDVALYYAAEGAGAAYSEHALAFINNRTIGENVTDAQITYMAVLACGAEEENGT